MLSLYILLKISYVFKLQDKHNASFFSNMSWKELPQSGTKVIKKSGNPLLPSDFLCVGMADGAEFWLLAVPFFLSFSSAAFRTCRGFMLTVCSPECLAALRHSRRFCGTQNLYLLPGELLTLANVVIDRPNQGTTICPHTVKCKPDEQRGYRKPAEGRKRGEA